MKLNKQLKFYSKNNNQFLINTKRVDQQVIHSPSSSDITKSIQKDIIDKAHQINEIVHQNFKQTQQQFNSKSKSSSLLLSKVQTQQAQSDRNIIDQISQQLINQNQLRNINENKSKNDHAFRSPKTERQERDISHLNELKNKKSEIFNLKSPKDSQRVTPEKDRVHTKLKSQLQKIGLYKQVKQNVFESTISSNIDWYTQNLRSSNYQDYFDDLNQQLVQFLSDLPTGRQQAITLKNWFKKSIQSLNKSTISWVQDLQDIIVISSAELARQCKMECQERAQVIEEIGIAYATILNEFRDSNNFFKNKILLQKDEEIVRIQNMYETMRMNEVKQINELKNQLGQANNEINRQAKVVKDIDQRYQNIRSQYTNLKKIAKILKSNIIILQQELDKMTSQRDKLVNKINNFDFNSKDIKIKVGRKSQILSSSLLLSSDEKQNYSSDDEINEKEENNPKDQELIQGLKLDQKGMDDLNELIINIDKVIQVREIECTPDLKYLKQFYKDIYQQTDLQFINNKYDILIKNMDVANLNIEHLEYKDKIEKQAIQIVQQPFEKDKQLVQQNIKKQSLVSIKPDSPIRRNYNQSFQNFVINSSTKNNLQDESESSPNIQNLEIVVLTQKIELLKQELIQEIENRKKVENFINHHFISKQEDVNNSNSNNQDQSLQTSVKQMNQKDNDNSQICNNESLIQNLIAIVQSYKKQNQLSMISSTNNKLLSSNHRQNQITFQKEKESMLALLKISNSQLETYKQNYFNTCFDLESLEKQMNTLEIKYQDSLSQNQQLQENIQQIKQQSLDLRQKYKIDELEENERQQQIAKKQKKNLSQPRMTSSMQAKNLLQSKEFQFGQKVTIQYDFQKNNQGSSIVEKVKRNQQGQMKNFIPLKLVLKQISMIYFEKIQQSKENLELLKQEMASFAYSYFMAQFGFKKIADQKFLILILSIKNYMQNIRVNMFAKFIGLADGAANYSNEELKKYLEILDFTVNINTQGTSIKDNFSEIKFYIPYIRVIAYLGQFTDTRLTVDENNELRKEIESLKEIDPKGMNKMGVIDFDLFMLKLLNRYRGLVNRAKEYVINAFAASDLDGNGMCNFEEWVLLNRHIENDTLDPTKLTSLFFDYADIINGEEQNMSFERFAQVSVENNLFTDQAQNKFLGIQRKEQMEKKLIELKEEWPQLMQEFLKKFETMTVISEEEIEHWKEIINALNLRITGEIQFNTKPLLIAYKILEKECEVLFESQEYQNESHSFQQSMNSSQLYQPSVDKDLNKSDAIIEQEDQNEQQIENNIESFKQIPEIDEEDN